MRELSQLELVWEALRLALRALGEVDAAWVAQAVPTAYRTQYLERRSDSRLTAEERQAELVRVGQDGAWLLDRLAATDAGVLRTLPEVETLTTIWQQRYERADDGVRWRSKTLDSTELIVTPHDPGSESGRNGGTSGGATRSTSPRPSPSRPPLTTRGRSILPTRSASSPTSRPARRPWRRPGAGRDPRT
ncbi:MAG: hypothetical protein U0893_16040 [Chloroflexota bacterium]